ncbi:lasso peptide biosynthesis protein [Streptomyces megasporus]|uniref:lasso peptide biosynthesis protein n=1 Tax=Streptomyces megasporus TaxID=44060 RepID=UPI000D1192D6|nr:lasso peptide biosynthesis protein [Streptomyces megasporus]
MATGLLALPRSAREAATFLAAARAGGGIYQLDRWPARRGNRRPTPRAVARAVVRLRIAQRLTTGFLDPVEDALYLTAGLRGVGLPATFHLGREIVPASSFAGFYAWVECDGQVVSTSLPVREEYIEVHRSAEG